MHTPIAATNPEDATAAGTSLDVRERGDALDSVADVLSEMPGARVHSTGGFGAPAHVSLRGAGIEHTTVLLGIAAEHRRYRCLRPEPRAVGGARHIEVYRGGAPVWWSDGAIGGLVRLVPRQAEQSYLRAQTGVGSFGRFELSATSAVATRGGAHPAFFSHVALSRTDNDYAYVDDGQTRFDDSDDATLHQQNAETHGRRRARALRHRPRGRSPGHGRPRARACRRHAGPARDTHRARQPPAAAHARRAQLDQGTRATRRRAPLSAASPGQRQRAEQQALGCGGRARTSVPVASDDLWTRGYGRLATSFALLSFLEPTLVATLSRDDYRPEDPLAFSMPPRASGRTTRSARSRSALARPLGNTRLELRPSLRGQWSQTSIWAYRDVFGLPGERSENDDAIATYRIATVVAPWPALGVSRHRLRRGARIPSIFELFGDRVFTQANPELVPERSAELDVGAVLLGSSGRAARQLEARGFALFIDDMIGYRRTAQFR